MKRFSILCVIVACLVTACSTWKSVPDELDTFIEKTETSAAKYSTEDWEQSDIEYEALLEAYRQHKDDYTPEQKARVVKAIGRYHALKVVYGVNEAAGLIRSIKEIVPSYLEGIDEVIKEEASGLSGLLKSILDPTEIKGVFEDISSDVETLMEEVSDSLDTVMSEWDSALNP